MAVSCAALALCFTYAGNVGQVGASVRLAADVEVILGVLVELQKVSIAHQRISSSTFQLAPTVEM